MSVVGRLPAGVAPVVLLARGIGGVPALSSLPGPALAAFALATRLGDPWVVFALLTALYWRPAAGLSRDRGALLLALATLTATLVATLKLGFALPRPPGATTAPAGLAAPLAAAFVEDGFGFPSGHAAGATVVYGGLGALLGGGGRRRRAVVAAAVIAAVGLSRVALGVHYLVDVVAGTGLGLAVLVAGVGTRGTWGGRRGPGRWFTVAAVAALAGVALAGMRGEEAAVREAAVALGGAIGGVAGWQVVLRGGNGGAVSPTVAGAGVVVAGGALAAAEALSPPAPAAALLGAVGVGVVVALPALTGTAKAA